MKRGIKRKLIIGLLGLGTVVGYGSAFASARCKAHHRRAHFEHRVSEICTSAAMRVYQNDGEPSETPPAHRPHRRGRHGHGHHGPHGHGPHGPPGWGH